MSMNLVHLGATDLIKGYNAIRRAETALPSAWRARLKAAQVRRLQYAQKAQLNQADPNGWIHHINPVWLIALAIGLALLAGMACLGFAWLQDAALKLVLLVQAAFLAFLGAAAAVAALIIYRRRRFLVQAARSPHLTQIAPWVDMLPRWRSGMQGVMPEEAPYTGYEGELDFMNRLLALDMPGYIFYRLQQRRGEDLDIVYVGSKGVWVFEVKHWKGIARYKNGAWQHLKQDEYTKKWYKEELKQPLHEQWRRGGEDLQDTLKRRADWVANNVKGMLTVRGGIVFSYEGMKMDLEKPLPVSCGISSAWISKLAQAPDVPGYTEMVGLQVVEALLIRHRSVCSDPVPLRDMNAYARKVIAATEKELKRQAG